MELEVNRTELLNVLQKTQTIIEKKSTMPILSHVLLQADEDLKIIATDLELKIESICPAKVIQRGEIAIPGTKLYEITRLLSSESVYLKEKENHWVDIKGGRAFFSLASLPAEDFPTFPQTGHLKTVSISANQLRKLIIKTQFSMAREIDETNKELAGIYFEKVSLDQPKVRLVSSDGYRLTYIEAPLPDLDVFQFEKGIIIPKKAVIEILHLTEEKEPLEIGFDETIGIVKTKNNSLFIRLLDKKFPHYESYIPKAYKCEATVPKDGLKEILKRMLTIITTKNKAAKFLFSPSKLLVQVDNSEIGMAMEDIEIEYNSEPFQIIFNTSFLLDVLNVMESPMVHLGLNKEDGCVLTGEEDLGFKALIMPIVG